MFNFPVTCKFDGTHKTTKTLSIQKKDINMSGKIASKKEFAPDFQCLNHLFESFVSKKRIRVLKHKKVYIMQPISFPLVFVSK